MVILQKYTIWSIQKLKKKHTVINICSGKTININNLVKGFSDLVDDFEDNKSEYFYKYYKATRQAEKDIKKEEKKKKQWNLFI